MTKHTPGPWVRCGNVIRAMGDNGETGIGQFRLRADAHIAAAAPDLLAACKAALALLADPDGDAFDATRVEEQLRQAIAKAVPHA